MAIGTDDLDFENEVINLEGLILPNQESESSQELNLLQEEDYIDSLLRDRGIEDKSKIKFEGDDGEVEEKNWDDLSNSDKRNILNSSSYDPETALDDSEILLINSIRQSGVSPSEYLNLVEKAGIDRYMQNAYASQYQYAVDQYSDDELFVADFISRMGNVSEDEAKEALEQAKSNKDLFAKLIEAIRNEYKTIETENALLALIEQEQQAQEQYEQFTQLVEDQINLLTEISGYDLNLEPDDMLLLYDFITGVDGAGINHFSKALSDPKTLVLTAWFALNGPQMIEDITAYFKNELAQVRKESYERGKADANKTGVIYKNKNKESSKGVYDDLDDYLT